MAAYHSTPASALSSPQLPLLQYSDLKTGEELVYNILLALTLCLSSSLLSFESELLGPFLLEPSSCVQVVASLAPITPGFPCPALLALQVPTPGN